MLPLLIVVAGIGIGLLHDPSWAPPWFDARVTLAAIPALVALHYAASRALVAIAAERPRDGSWETHVRRLLRAANAYRVLALPLYAALVHVFQWPRVVGDSWGLAGIPLVEILLVLAPFFALLLTTFLGLHAAESVARAERLPLRDYLLFHARMGLFLPLVPALVVFTVFDLLQQNAAARTTLAVYPFFYWIILLALAFTLVSLAPTLMSRLWATTPMPDGPLKDRLLALCDQAHIPRPRLLVWPTGAFGHVNAAVVGLFPFNRIIMFTDALLASFTPDETAAVLAHELGHARHRHLLFYFSMAVAAALFVTFADFTARDLASETARLTGAIAFLAAFAGGAFGFYSRRFERQADLFAARLVPAATYIGALEKVAALNGNTRKVWFFTHMSIEQRVNYLIEAAVRPEAAGLFERNLRRAVTAGVAFLAFSLGGAGYTVARQIEEAPIVRQKLEAARLGAEAREAWEAGRPAEAIEKARQAAEKDAASALYYAEYLCDAGRPFEAEAPYLRAREAWEEGSEERRVIDERLAMIESMKTRRVR